MAKKTGRTEGPAPGEVRAREGPEVVVRLRAEAEAAGRQAQGQERVDAGANAIRVHMYCQGLGVAPHFTVNGGWWPEVESFLHGPDLLRAASGHRGPAVLPLGVTLRAGPTEAAMRGAAGGDAAPQLPPPFQVSSGGAKPRPRRTPVASRDFSPSCFGVTSLGRRAFPSRPTMVQRVSEVP